MADASDHVIPDSGDAPGVADVRAGRSTPGRRPRLSRPVPSHLFAQRRAAADENGGRTRPTRVVPTLADRVAQTDEQPPVSAATDVPAAAAPAPSSEVSDASGEPAGRQAGMEYPPDLVLIVRADGTVLYVNRPLGPRGEEDVIGSDFYDWVFPEQHALVREALARVFSTGTADGVELSGIQQHDPEAWYECRIAPNHREGKVVSATIIARDVTRYKRAEQALRTEHEELRRLVEERTADLEQLRTQLARRPGDADEARAQAGRFRTLLDAAGEAIFVTDPQTEALVDVNETACRWLRGRREDLIGANVRGLALEFPILPPVSPDVQFTETRDSRRPLILEGIHRRRDGSTFPVEVAVASHGAGEREYVLAVVRDVKGRRRADEALAESRARYQALVEQSFDAVFLTTRAGEIVEGNEAALELFGYEREGFIGLDARVIMPRVEDVRRFQREMADAGVVRRLEVELMRRDGTRFAAWLSATRRRDPQDRLLGYQWVVRRVTSDLTAAVPDPALFEPAAVEPEPLEPAPVAAAAPSEALLVVDGDRRALGDSQAALERIGRPVLAAGTAGEAVRLLRSHTPGIALAVVGPVPDGAPEDLARDLRAVFPQLRVILLTPEDPFGVLERAADLAVEACLRHPAHPLALVQSVREAFGELPGA